MKIRLLNESYKTKVNNKYIGHYIDLLENFSQDTCNFIFRNQTRNRNFYRRVGKLSSKGYDVSPFKPNPF